MWFNSFSLVVLAASKIYWCLKGSTNSFHVKVASSSRVAPTLKQVDTSLLLSTKFMFVGMQILCTSSRHLLATSGLHPPSKFGGFILLNLLMVLRNISHWCWLVFYTKGGVVIDSALLLAVDTHWLESLVLARQSLEGLLSESGLTRWVAGYFILVLK